MKLQTSPPETWLYKLEGGVISSPAISDKTLYLGSTNGMFFAINIDDGTRVWNHKTGGSIISSPLINGDTVYFGSVDNYFYALNKKKMVILYGNIKQEMQLNLLPQ